MGLAFTVTARLEFIIATLSCIILLLIVPLIPETSMMLSRALSLPDISRALSGPGSPGRTSMLQECLGRLLQGIDFEAECSEPGLAQVFETLRLKHQQKPGLGEVNAVLFARAGDRTSLQCVLALLFELPVMAVQHALRAENPNLLLIMARSKNFAWSSVRAIMTVAPHTEQDSLLEYERCEDYHAIAIVDCERLVRLIKVHLQQRSVLMRQNR